MVKLTEDERTSQMVHMFQSGQVLAEIGGAFGLTRSRVQQILAGQGLSRRDGGAAVNAENAARRRENRQVKKQRLAEKQSTRLFDQAHRVFGTPPDVMTSLCGEPVLHHGRLVWDSVLVSKYRGVRCQALMKFGSYLSFADWFAIWTDSGHFAPDSGPEPGWCLIQKEYEKPWGPDNAQAVRHGVWRSTGGLKNPRKAA